MFREEAIALLNKNLDLARDGKPFTVVFYDITPPSDHTTDYTRAIEMLEWSVEDEVDISEADFRAYVQDDWGWKNQFLSNKYATSALASFSEDD